MISNDSNNDSGNSAKPQVQDPQAAAGKVAPAMDPRKPIEVASTGTGTITDPPAKDNKPPNVYGLDLLA
jgi:hypothetical protein